MICVRKARRANSKYAPLVIPRIIQQTIHQPCQKWVKFSPSLPQGELFHAILRPCPQKKLHGSWHTHTNTCTQARTHTHRYTSKHAHTYDTMELLDLPSNCDHQG